MMTSSLFSYPKLCLSLILLFSIASANASELLLADVTADELTDTYQLSVEINEETQALENLYFDTFKDGKLSKRDDVTVEIFIENGIKLPKKGKLNLVTIKGENFDKDQGGRFIIRAVYNILTNKRKNYEYELAKDQTGWKLFKDGKPFTKLHAQVKKVYLVGPVGVKDLIVGN